MATRTFKDVCPDAKLVKYVTSVEKDGLSATRDHQSNQLAQTVAIGLMVRMREMEATIKSMQNEIEKLSNP